MTLKNIQVILKKILMINYLTKARKVVYLKIKCACKFSKVVKNKTSYVFFIYANYGMANE